MLHLGKTPARVGAVKFKMRKYLNLSVLPALPSGDFGHDGLVTTPWNMLGNDKAGCCVWSGGGHESMLWNAAAGKTITFTDQSTLSDYSACTGYDPNDPSTDNGTDMQAAASYRLKTGLLDADGNRHKIGAYLALDVGNVEEHLYALYLFGAVGIGINFPDSAMDQFNAGQPWTVVPGATVSGGHYICGVARRSSRLVICTWGAEDPMDDTFLQTYNDESLAYVSAEYLNGGKTLDGFDAEQLNADLAAL